MLTFQTANRISRDALSRRLAGAYVILDDNTVVQISHILSNDVLYGRGSKDIHIRLQHLDNEPLDTFLFQDFAIHPGRLGFWWTQNGIPFWVGSQAGKTYGWGLSNRTMSVYYPKVWEELRNLRIRELMCVLNVPAANSVTYNGVNYMGPAETTVVPTFSNKSLCADFYRSIQ